MVRFEVEELDDGTRKLVLSGRMDVTSVPAAEIAFTATVAASRQVVLDLSGVTFLSSLGVRLLLASTRVVTRRGGRVALFGAQPFVAEVLAMTGLTQVLPVVPTEAAALALMAA